MNILKADRVNLVRVVVVKTIILSLALLFSNCIVIKVNRGGIYSGFDKLTPTEKKRIIFPVDMEQFNNAADTVVFAVAPDEIKQYMDQFDSCLVYFWNATCPSPYWKPPIVVQSYCKKNNLRLIIVVRNYDEAKILFTIQSKLEPPVFVMNSFHYETDKCHKYVPKFRQELLGNKDKKRGTINYWLYRHGVFEKCLDFEE
jgi:hypothetical protein